MIRFRNDTCTFIMVLRQENGIFKRWLATTFITVKRQLTISGLFTDVVRMLAHAVISAPPRLANIVTAARKRYLIHNTITTFNVLLAMLLAAFFRLGLSIYLLTQATKLIFGRKQQSNACPVDHFLQFMCHLVHIRNDHNCLLRVCP